MRPTTYCGEGFVLLYAMPNPFLLNKICLNQHIQTKLFCVLYLSSANVFYHKLKGTVNLDLIPKR
jgi:hypothetical protein